MLWIVQGVLAVMFAMAGVMKSIQPKEKQAKNLPWVGELSPSAVRFIGIVELLGALGLILPAATGVAPVLTPLAATGLGVIMLLAALTHARRKEPGSIAFNAIFAGAGRLRRLGRFGPHALWLPSQGRRKSKRVTVLGANGQMGRRVVQ